jgi:DNA-binding IclR family transcriptional regulator
VTAPRLSAGQARVLRAAQAIEDRCGRAPTAQELAAACAHPVATIQMLLDGLAERGWLLRLPGLCRGLLLLRRLPEDPPARGAA